MEIKDDVQIKESYRYITISGTAQTFEDSLTSAVLSGFEVEHINSNPVAVPNPLQNKVDIQIIYSAVLKRKEKLQFKLKEEKSEEEKKDDKSKSGDKKLILD